MTGPEPTNIEETEPAVSYRLEDRLARADSTEAETTDGETYVLALESGRYFRLGEVGSFIWARLDGSRDLASIAADVAGAYEVSTEEAGQDLLEFAAMLTELGLVETSAGG